MEPEETFYVTERRVACDGGGGPLGHPRVFLQIDETGEVTCPYCSRHFVLGEDAEAEAGH
jgi:uncharacterized Zn-finger protein